MVLGLGTTFWICIHAEAIYLTSKKMKQQVQPSRSPFLLRWTRQRGSDNLYHLFVQLLNANQSILGNFYFMPVPISSGQCLLGGESLTGVRGKDGGVSDELMLHNKLPPNLVAQYQQQSVLSLLTVSMRRALLRVSGSGPSCSSLQTLAGAKGQGGL